MNDRFYVVAKRAADFALSAVLLLVFAPLLGVVALLIAVTSPGPVFFRQRRVGKFGEVFEIIKFRSMVVGAESIGPQVTAANDVRITSLGKVLRACKIDELPQLINVLKGEMSLVGPRPQVEKYVALFPGELKGHVLSVVPGITGPTALKFRHEESILEGREDREEFYRSILLPMKCEMDARYVNERTLAGDAKILLKTLWVFVSGVGHRLLGRPIGTKIEVDHEFVARIPAMTDIEVVELPDQPHAELAPSFKESREKIVS